MWMSRSRAWDTSLGTFVSGRVEIGLWLLFNVSMVPHSLTVNGDSKIFIFYLEHIGQGHGVQHSQW